MSSLVSLLHQVLPLQLNAHNVFSLARWNECCTACWAERQPGGRQDGRVTTGMCRSQSTVRGHDRAEAGCAAVTRLVASRLLRAETQAVVGDQARRGTEALTNCCCCCCWLSSILVGVNSFSIQLLSSCTDEYAHTYDISTYSVQQWSCELGLGFLLTCCPCAVHTHSRNMQTPCRNRVDL